MHEWGTTYHPGETWVQQRANTAQAADAKRVMMMGSLSAGAMSFVDAQALLIVSSLDSAGRVWASVVSGAPGIVRARDAQSVELQLAATVLDGSDPLRSNGVTGAALGLLAIDFSTRRRLRINGRVTEKTFDRLSMKVDVAYPNCPRYLRRRSWRPADLPAEPSLVVAGTGPRLTPEQLAWIRGADTFFVASAHPRFGTDASHRGGDPGFVQVSNDGSLVVPDYAGNQLFNTLGNFVSYPRAGLLFINFGQRRVLQLSGGVRLEWISPSAPEVEANLARQWRFFTETWREAALPGRLLWDD